MWTSIIDHSAVVEKQVSAYPRHFGALIRLEDSDLLSDDAEIQYEKCSKFRHHPSEIITYIGNNAHLIPNYGKMYRYGETITISFAESAVNDIIAKRMVKKQQMQWSPIGVTLSVADKSGGSEW